VDAKNAKAMMVLEEKLAKMEGQKIDQAKVGQCRFTLG
jgi:hypothetical protein